MTTLWSCCTASNNANLSVLKNYPKPEELALNFTITEEEFGMPKTIDLLPGGADIAVTAENRHECEF
jgi:ubiquitin-protein ligase E3 C